ncbi:hypothetical protein AGLY_011015 [Aphis glycines]|uniref:Uncharacterized protein n=1 Tax=Aphis glycines TaxID=307491 RepID=A0A6G0TC84_APHGL|nr:hypothetical protein AGLY_011015 [Aphis glycines]
MRNITNRLTVEWFENNNNYHIVTLTSAIYYTNKIALCSISNKLTGSTDENWSAIRTLSVPDHRRSIMKHLASGQLNMHAQKLVVGIVKKKIVCLAVVLLCLQFHCSIVQPTYYTIKLLIVDDKKYNTTISTRSFKCFITKICFHKKTCQRWRIQYFNIMFHQILIEGCGFAAEFKVDGSIPPVGGGLLAI